MGVKPKKKYYYLKIGFSYGYKISNIKAGQYLIKLDYFKHNSFNCTFFLNIWKFITDFRFNTNYYQGLRLNFFFNLSKSFFNFNLKNIIFYTILIYYSYFNGNKKLYLFIHVWYIKNVLCIKENKNIILIFFIPNY